MLSTDNVALAKVGGANVLLGKGGQAPVFDGFILEGGEWVPSAHKFCSAVKFSRGDVAHEVSVHQRLKREPSCSLSEVGMRGIVGVFGAYEPSGPEGGTVVMAFEKCTGGGLDKLLEYSPSVAIPLEQRRGMVRQLAAVLAHTHAHNVVHADLKTENVMLAADGSLRLIDVRASGGAGGIPH